jgi:hypothetical protein
MPDGKKELPYQILQTGEFFNHDSDDDGVVDIDGAGLPDDILAYQQKYRFWYVLWGLGAENFGPRIEKNMRFWIQK